MTNNAKPLRVDEVVEGLIQSAYELGNTHMSDYPTIAAHKRIIGDKATQAIEAYCAERERLATLRGRARALRALRALREVRYEGVVGRDNLEREIQKAEAALDHTADTSKKVEPAKPLGVDEILGELQLEACNHAIGSPTALSIPKARDQAKSHLIELVESLLGEDKLDLDKDIPTACYKNSYWLGAWEGVKFSRQALVKSIEGGEG